MPSSSRYGRDKGDLARWDGLSWNTGLYTNGVWSVRNLPLLYFQCLCPSTPAIGNYVRRTCLPFSHRSASGFGKVRSTKAYQKGDANKRKVPPRSGAAEPRGISYLTTLGTSKPPRAAFTNFEAPLSNLTLCVPTRSLVFYICGLPRFSSLRRLVDRSTDIQHTSTAVCSDPSPLMHEVQVLHGPLTHRHYLAKYAALSDRSCTSTVSS